MLFGAVHRSLAVTTEGAWCTFAMRLTPLELPQRGGPHTHRSSEPAAVSGTPDSRARGDARRREPPPLDGAIRSRAGVPLLRSVPGALLLVQVVRAVLNAIEHDAGAIGAPAICEGIGELHTPSSLAAPAHVRELRWLDTPDMARGVMRGVFSHQREDGSIPERIFSLGRSHAAVKAQTAPLLDPPMARSLPFFDKCIARPSLVFCFSTSSKISSRIKRA